jgi:hypothetical protein
VRTALEAQSHSVGGEALLTSDVEDLFAQIDAADFDPSLVLRERVVAAGRASWRMPFRK